MPIASGPCKFTVISSMRSRTVTDQATAVLAAHNGRRDHRATWRIMADNNLALSNRDGSPGTTAPGPWSAKQKTVKKHHRPASKWESSKRWQSGKPNSPPESSLHGRRQAAHERCCSARLAARALTGFVTQLFDNIPKPPGTIRRVGGGVIFVFDRLNNFLPQHTHLALALRCQAGSDCCPLRRP